MNMIKKKIGKMMSWEANKKKDHFSTRLKEGYLYESIVNLIHSSKSLNCLKRLMQDCFIG